MRLTDRIPGRVDGFDLLNGQWRNINRNVARHDKSPRHKVGKQEEENIGSGQA